MLLSGTTGGNLGLFPAGKDRTWLASFARRILTATGQLLGAHFLLEQAVLAQSHLREMEKDQFDYNYYLGKTLSAGFLYQPNPPQRLEHHRTGKRGRPHYPPLPGRDFRLLTSNNSNVRRLSYLSY